MKKDLNHKRRRSKRASPVKSAGQVPWRWIVLTTILGLFFCSGVFLYKKKGQDLPVMTSYFSRLTHWIAEHKSHLHQGLNKVKQLAVNKADENQEIHFEFYTALPNMQMASASGALAQPALKPVTTSVVKVAAAENTSAQAAVVAKADVIENPDPQAGNDANSADAEKSATDIKNKMANTANEQNNVAAKAPIVNPDALEQELSAQIQEPNGYMLQMGVFRSAEAAERYKVSFTSLGYPINVVKVATANKRVFRVEMGPFNNKNQARLAQIDLEKKGIMSTTLHKQDMG